MPPKKSKKAAGKGKSSAVVDGLSTDEMSKDQLEEHIIRLREELDREREEKSYFQLDRDKIQAFWEVSKRSLEEAKAELRSRVREREEAEERHRVEITLYKQKLKHVLSEHHAAVSGLKADAAASTSLLQSHNAESELALRGDVRGLQADRREKRLHNHKHMKELRLQHQVELMELTNDYDRRIREMQLKYHSGVEALVQDAARKREAELGDIEERMKSRAEALIQENQQALRGAEEYYSRAHAKILQDQKLLREQLAELTQQQAQTSQELSAAQRENKRLRRSLQEAELQLPELQRRLQESSLRKAQIMSVRAQVKLVEKELRDLTVEHELLLQAFHKVQQERDDLLARQEQSLLEVQQRCGLKELLLERKLAALTEEVERAEAQVCAGLSASGAGREAGSGATNRLQEIFQSKQDSVDALQRDVERGRQENQELLQVCEEKL